MVEQTKTASAPKRPKRLSLRDEQKLMTRERLLSGALDVFAEKGYSLTTVDDITTQAGASRATFYLHFKSRFEVIEALYDRHRSDVAELFARLDEVILSGSRAAIRDWTVGALNWYESNSVYSLALEQAVSIEGSPAASMRRPYLEFMPSLRDAWPAERHSEVNMRIWLLVKMMTSFYIGEHVYGLFADVSKEGAVETITDLCLGALQPPSA